MIKTPEIHLFSQKKLSYHSTKIIQYDLTVPISAPKRLDVVFGIDPGNTHMGLTVLPVSIVQPTKCFEITFPSERMAISRVTQIRLALCDIISLTGQWDGFNILVSVEGSAYSMPYRNTELAEARITAATWFLDNYQLNQSNFIFIPPLTVRKNVFGDGKIKAENTWPQLKGDAASSLAIALAGLALSDRSQG